MASHYSDAGAALVSKLPDELQSLIGDAKVPRCLVELLLATACDGAKMFAAMGANEEAVTALFDSMDFSKAGKGNKKATKLDVVRIKALTRTLLTAAAQAVAGAEAAAAPTTAPPSRSEAAGLGTLALVALAPTEGV